VTAVWPGGVACRGTGHRPQSRPEPRGELLELPRHNGAARGDAVALAGLRKEDLVRNLQDFKSGRKPATIMHQLAKGYTDAQLELIAGWFAAQKPVK